MKKLLHIACFVLFVGCSDESGEPSENSSTNSRTDPSPDKTTSPENSTQAPSNSESVGGDPHAQCDFDEDCRDQDSVTFPETAQCRVAPTRMVKECTDCHSDDECPAGYTCVDYTRCVLE